ncbi:hypothetical protein [Streptomyces roseus]|uniref:hypothetical protein n=2 Tax=Streptomyces TaxID=1883 RepID=UPI00069D998A|nr:hypothetical protein [Streptomyces roseus]
MDIPTLILLGTAGGLLRGVLDLYTRFVSWQADRRVHRQSTAEGVAQGTPPQFGAYFDPAVDIVAAALHSVLGAGAAVLFGTTGQISGEYAALVVGMSAPILLTQLSRIQTVNEALTGDRQLAGAAEAVTELGAPPAIGVVSAGGADGPGTAEPRGTAEAPRAAAAAAPSRTEPPPAPSPAAPPADPARPPLPAGGSAFRARPTPPSRPAVASADARTPDSPSGDIPPGGPQLPDPARPGGTPVPADPAAGTSPGFDGRGAPRWRQRPAIGEEGL